MISFFPNTVVITYINDYSHFEFC